MAEEKIDLTRVAEIARLKLSDEEKAVISKDLEGILGQFAQINAIEGLDKVEENDYVIDGANALREDVISECKNPDDITKLFTRKEGKFLVAPKSLD